MSNRTRKIRLAYAWGLCASAVGGLLTGIVSHYGHGNVSIALIVLIFIAILAATFAALLPWWRKLDHMQRDGHLTSWYWGGAGAGGLALLLLLAIKGSQSEMVMGAVVIWLAQTAGYLVTLGAWRIKHRASAS